MNGHSGSDGAVRNLARRCFTLVMFFLGAGAGVSKSLIKFKGTSFSTSSHRTLKYLQPEVRTYSYVPDAFSCLPCRDATEVNSGDSGPYHFSSYNPLGFADLGDLLKLESTLVTSHPRKCQCSSSCE